jgi:hypothetical protein
MSRHSERLRVGEGSFKLMDEKEKADNIVVTRLLKVWTRVQ